MQNDYFQNLDYFVIFINNKIYIVYLNRNINI